MDTNKGIKILRIVSLTLGILSMLLFLWTRYAKAEETVIRTWDNSTDSMPLPFGPEYYGWIDFDAQQYLDQRDIASNFIDLSEPYVTYYAFYSDIYYVLVWVQYADADHIYNITGNWGGALTDIQLTHNQVVAYKATYCDISTNTCGEFWFNNAPQAINFASMGTVSNGEYTLQKQSYNYFYPIGSNMQNLGNLQHTFFSTGMEEETIGDITDIFQETQLIAEDTSETINDMSQATYRNWFQAIIGTIWSSANNLVQNFKSFFAPFFNRIVTKFNEVTDFFEQLIEKVTQIVEILQEYVANDLTAGGIAQVWEINYTNSHINTLVETGEDIKDALLELGDVEPNEPVITVNIINNTFFGTTEEYQFNFTWYNNIKTPILTFITAFWLVGLGLHLFTQIPNMIHGVSGTAHGIQNATPTETYSHKDIYH